MIFHTQLVLSARMPVCPSARRFHSQLLSTSHALILSGTKAGSLSAFNTDIKIGLNNQWSIRNDLTGVVTYSTTASSFSLLDFELESGPSFVTNTLNISQWTLPDNQTGVVSFVADSLARQFSTRLYPLPAIGTSQVLFPPPGLTCNNYNCTTQVQLLFAEGPIPCPLGYFCRAGVASLNPVPKNFSTPQKCYDGFYCPIGSVSPQGTGPCPNGYFCPTNIDAVPCPPGTMCPGVGNTGPVDCNPGTFNPYSGRANCMVCPLGSICPDSRTLHPEVRGNDFCAVCCLFISAGLPVIAHTVFIVITISSVITMSIVITIFIVIPIFMVNTISISLFLSPFYFLRLLIDFSLFT